jgi:sigma-B regulation protein RsbU (phosphoserine phosphatase)
LLEQTLYQETVLTLSSGDLLAMFSDGLIEASTPKHEEFGTRRIENVLRQNASRQLKEIVDLLFEEISGFEQGRPRRDDQTLLLVRVR